MFVNDLNCYQFGSLGLEFTIHFKHEDREIFIGVKLARANSSQISAPRPPVFEIITGYFKPK